MVYMISGQTDGHQFSTPRHSEHHIHGHAHHNNNTHPEDAEDGQEASENETIFKSFIGFAIFGFLLIVYSGVGAYIFKSLEEDDDRAKVMSLRQTVALERIRLTSRLNDTCQCGNDTQCCSINLEAFTKILREYENALDVISDGSLKLFIDDNVPKSRWKYFHSLLFVFTLVTTIGYGNLTPKTTTGRIFCILFSLLGIPLALIEIALAGKLLARSFLLLFGKFVKLDIKTPDEKSSMIQKMLGTTLSIIGVLNLLLCYNTIGAFLYDYTEGWGFVNSFYFCFTTLTTVGFGDLVPQAGVASGNPFASVRVVYVLFGLALTSTSFELVRTQYAKAWSKRAKNKTPALFVAVQKVRQQQIVAHGHGNGNAVADNSSSYDSPPPAYSYKSPTFIH